MTGLIEHPLSMESLDQMTAKHETACPCVAQ